MGTCWLEQSRGLSRVCRALSQALSRTESESCCRQTRIKVASRLAMRKFNGIAVLSGGGGCSLVAGGFVADTARLLQTFVADGTPRRVLHARKKNSLIGSKPELRVAGISKQLVCADRREHFSSSEARSASVTEIFLKADHEMTEAATHHNESVAGTALHASRCTGLTPSSTAATIPAIQRIRPNIPRCAPWIVMQIQWTCFNVFCHTLPIVHPWHRS